MVRTKEWSLVSCGRAGVQTSDVEDRLFLDSERADGWTDGKHPVYWEVTRADKPWASERDDPQADLKLNTESPGYLWLRSKF